MPYLKREKLIQQSELKSKVKKLLPYFFLCKFYNNRTTKEFDYSKGELPFASQ